jgi:hypothetical protein
MKSLVLWATVFIIALVPAMAQKAQNKNGSVEQQIKDLAKQGKQATLNNDASWIDRNTASDYTAVLAVGGMLPREAMIRERKSGDLKYESIDVVYQKVRTYGNTAVLNETADIKATYKSNDIGRRYYVTQVWVKQGGAWKLVNLQSTRAAK